MRPVNVIFLGPPGAGKGTQAARMSERFGLAAMSSGDRLRQEIKAGTEIGVRAESHVSRGTLVPDDVITGVMLAGIRSLSPAQGFILDGFPRTVPQAASLDAGLAELGRRLDAVVDFRMDDSLIVERITTRRVCSACGTTYNVRFCPPKAAQTCDVCGGEVVQRVDDTEAVIVTRLATYRRQTAPVEAFYEQRGQLRVVDASPGADEVEACVAALLSGLGDDA